MARFFKNILSRRAGIYLALLALTNYAQAASNKFGYLGLAPMATTVKLSSEGLNTINSRLGNSVVLSVPQAHGAGMALGGKGLYLDRNFRLIRNLTFEILQDKISSKGMAGELSSNLNLVNATGSLEWRIFPQTPMNIKQMTQWSLLKRAYLSAGPVLGVSSLSYDYNLVSRLNSSEIRYTSSTLLAAVGAQTTLGFALFSSVHAGIGLKAIQNVPVSTSTTITQFTLESQDLRYKGNELGVDKLTNAKLTQFSAFGSLALIL
jgi:hypothetical protein